MAKIYSLKTSLKKDQVIEKLYKNTDIGSVWVWPILMNFLKKFRGEISKSSFKLMRTGLYPMLILKGNVIENNNQVFIKFSIHPHPSMYIAILAIIVISVFTFSIFSELSTFNTIGVIDYLFFSIAIFVGLVINFLFYSSDKEKTINELIDLFK